VIRTVASLGATLITCAVTRQIASEAPTISSNMDVDRTSSRRSNVLPLASSVKRLDKSKAGDAALTIRLSYHPLIPCDMTSSELILQSIAPSNIPESSGFVHWIERP
jgi:hypothetical protein